MIKENKKHNTQIICSIYTKFTSYYVWLVPEMCNDYKTNCRIPSSTTHLANPLKTSLALIYNFNIGSFRFMIEETFIKTARF